MHGRMVRMPNPNELLPGRLEATELLNNHAVTGNSLKPPFPDRSEMAIFGMGCFWGAERRFWSLPGVYVTAVGYAGGQSPNPTYEEVCSGLTGHTEAVLAVFDPQQITYEALLAQFWESHDPTQGMRQGNDVGTQYRSLIMVMSSGQQQAALTSKSHYQELLTQAGFGAITTQIVGSGPFYYAEEYHQQYLHKNPQGYCGLGGLNIAYAPTDAKEAAAQSVA